MYHHHLLDENTARQVKLPGRDRQISERSQVFVTMGRDCIALPVRSREFCLFSICCDCHFIKARKQQSTAHRRIECGYEKSVVAARICKRNGLAGVRTKAVGAQPFEITALGERIGLLQCLEVKHTKGAFFIADLFFEKAF